MSRTALFSLNDTTDAVKFANQLIQSGWKIIATQETSSLLKKKGLPVQDIADFTGVRKDYGFPPTLHAKVEYALTAQTKNCIDLVYVIPYPLSLGNDVGGRTLLALAVKGKRIPVMSIEDMKKVLLALSKSGELPENVRLELADKACFEIATHYASLVTSKEKYDFITGRFSYDLLNGENPYQIPASAFISQKEKDPLSLMNFKRVSGESPCFTNMADADCILHTLCLATEAFTLNTGSVPYVCVTAKHGNACGLGVSKASPIQAVKKALFGNPRAIWGGEVITNFPIDEQLATTLFTSTRRKRQYGDNHWMLDLIMAPSFTPEAIKVLGKRKGRKLFVNRALYSPVLKKHGLVYRMVRGGFLRQPPPTYILNLKTCQLDKNTLSEKEKFSLIIAWAVAFSSNHGGNEVSLAKDGHLLATGGGPSTVEAATVAVERAKENGHKTKGAVFAADAFFPFTDAPSVLCKAGITHGCVPSGSKHDADVKGFFHAHGVTVDYLPPEFRGFCRH